MRVNSCVLSVLAVFLLAVSFAAGCDKSLGFNNTPPEISSISRDLCYVGTNGILDLTCNAQDPDEDPFSIRWEASDGGFFPATAEGELISWIPPEQPGTYTVTATVSDEIDESSRSIEIEVGEELSAVFGNTSVTDNGSFYVIDTPAAIQVVEGANLTIGSGVTIVINERGGGLNVRGYMEINGTEDDPVYFKPNICLGENGVWEGIAFTGPAASGSMTHVNITMASDAVSAAGGAVLELDSCFIHDGAGIGINIENSTVSIYECRILDNSSGIHIVDSDAEITDCEIRDNGIYGIWLEENETETLEDSCDVTVEGCNIAANYNNGIVISWRGLPSINYNSIQHNGTYSGGYDMKMLQYFNDAGVNARYNYWGVTTDEEIRDVIFDGSDYYPSRPDIYVDFSGWLMSPP